MDRLPPFESAHLEAACKVLADTDRGLTGAEIGRLLQDINVPDVSSDMTKWKRLFNALAEIQNKHQVGNHLVMFINRAMNPVSYARSRDNFEWRQTELNVVLAFSGYEVNSSGQVARTNKETTLSGARSRAGKLRSQLEARNAHPEIYAYCRAELVVDNYFHAVLEAIKGVAERLRTLTGLGTDGADLVMAVFSVKAPLLKINDLRTETEQSEQKGFSNLLVGLFGTVRNPTAHAPKVVWPLAEHDALDIMSLISFVHRKLDNARRP